MHYLTWEIIWGMLIVWFLVSNFLAFIVSKEISIMLFINNLTCYKNKK